MFSRFTRTRGGATPALKKWAEMPIVRRMSITFASPSTVPSGRITACVVPSANTSLVRGSRIFDAPAWKAMPVWNNRGVAMPIASGSPFSRMITRTPSIDFMSPRLFSMVLRRRARISLRIKILFAAGMSSIESMRVARPNGAALPSLIVSGPVRADAAGSARLIGLASFDLRGSETAAPIFGAGAPPAPPLVFIRCVIRLRYSLAIERSEGSPFVMISINRSSAWMSSPCS